MDGSSRNATPRRPLALRLDFRERLTVSAAAVVAERFGDASALERMLTEDLEARTLLARAHPHRELGTLLPPAAAGGSAA